MKIFLLIAIQVSVLFGKNWNFSVPTSLTALVGSCVEIYCTFVNPPGYTSGYIIWYRQEDGGINDTQIYNSKDKSQVALAYQGRTSLTSKKQNTCSLKISNVTHEDAGYYYPGIHEEANSYSNRNKKIELKTTENPFQPEIIGFNNMIEGHPIGITCTVKHTCNSEPPTLQWNKLGQQKETDQVRLVSRSWRAKTEQIYTPTYEDYQTNLTCTATFPNGQKRHKTTNLREIKFSAKEVEIVPGSNSISDGDSMVLNCTFLNINPEPTHFSWFLNNTLLTNETDQILLIYDDSTIGTYTCGVHNEVGLSMSTPFNPYISNSEPMSFGQNLSFSFPSHLKALVGSCVEIYCIFNAQNYTTDDIIWYRHDYGRVNHVLVFNGRKESQIAVAYKGRTSLTIKKSSSCSLMINNVTHGDDAYYYPGIHGQPNTYSAENKTMRLQTIDEPYQPEISKFGDLTEGRPVIITCTVKHTCYSEPPTLQWNKHGQQKETDQVRLVSRSWRAKTEQIYTPTYEDYQTNLTCTATFPNGQIRSKTTSLRRIRFSAKEVRIVSGKKYFREGDTLALTCDFSSVNPETTNYSWYLNSSPLMNKTQKVLIIYHVTTVFTGNYTCGVHNKVGLSKSIPLYIDVNVIEPRAVYPAVYILAAITCLLLFVLIGCIYKRYRKLQDVNYVVAKHSENIYDDLQLENISQEYDTLMFEKLPAQGHNKPIDEQSPYYIFAESV